jgi:hypothetical protein
MECWVKLMKINEQKTPIYHPTNKIKNKKSQLAIITIENEQ